MVLRPPSADAESQDAQAAKALKLLRCYLSGDTTGLTEQEREVLAVVRLVVPHLEAERWEKRNSTDPPAALLGSQIIQLALCVRSAMKGLAVKEQFDIYQAKLSSEAFGEGGEDVEARVGWASKRHLEDFSKRLEELLKTTYVPSGNRSILAVLAESVDVPLSNHRFQDASSASSAPNNVINLETDEAFAGRSEEDKVFLRQIQALVAEQGTIHHSEVIQRIQGKKIPIPSSFRGQIGWKWFLDMLRRCDEFTVSSLNATNPQISLQAQSKRRRVDRAP